MTWSKEIGTMCCCILVACSAVQIRAMEIEDAPESVMLDGLSKLYEAVEFDHRLHIDGFACSACHHHTTGGGTQQQACLKCHADSGEAAEVACSSCHPASELIAGHPAAQPEDRRYHIDKPGLLGALHLQCLGCHRAESGPLGCEECHALTPAGSQRFAAAK